MRGLSNPSDQAKLAREVARHFSELGWTISQATDPRIDIIVKKKFMQFNISCLDRRIRRFLSEDTITQRMIVDAAHFRSNMNGSLVFILNFPLNVPFVKLGELGLSVFFADELTILSDLQSLSDRLVDDLDHRQMRLLQGNEVVCLSMAERLVQKGDIAAAIKWAEWPTLGVARPSAARYKLFLLCQQSGDMERAESILKDALNFQPYSVILLDHMLRIAKDRQDLARVAELEKALDSASNYPSDFESLMNRHRSRLNRPVEADALNPLKIKTKSGLLQRLFSRRKRIVTQN